MDHHNRHHDSVVIARQPIFDRDYRVYAYELLFRANRNDQCANVTENTADLATSRVINYAFLELGIERVIGKHVAFINLTRSFILDDEPIPASQGKVVLEVLEDIEVDEELLEGIRRLKTKGYTIALDDFIYHESLKPLVELASIIKVDILAINEQQLREHVTELRKYNVTLLAEKVETQADYQLCFDLGFDYFQGFFFCQPDIIEDSPVPDNQLTRLQLINKLQDPDVDFDDVEAIIRKDVGLTYKLLRLLNSAALALPRKIESIREGLILLGLKAIKTWTTLMVMSEMDFVPKELLDSTLIRAKMCESLSPAYQCGEENSFMVGLFSTIDAILDRPMASIIDPMPLSEVTKQALTLREGPLGSMLTDIIHYEQGQWDKLSDTPLSLEQFSEHYIAATEWAIKAGEVS